MENHKLQRKTNNGQWKPTLNNEKMELDNKTHMGHKIIKSQHWTREIQHWTIENRHGEI